MGEVISLDEYRARKAQSEATEEITAPGLELDFSLVSSIEELQQEVKRWRIATGLDEEES